jgi:hypothetical protein
MNKANLALYILLAVFMAQPLYAEVHIYCADHNNKKLIKIKEDGTLLWDFPNNNGHDVQLLKNGNVLIVTGEVQEVSPDKTIVWKVGKPVVQNAEAAQRLDNGHTVIADNGKHAVIELNEKDEEIWRFPPCARSAGWPTATHSFVPALRMKSGKSLPRNKSCGALKFLSLTSPQGSKTATP